MGLPPQTDAEDADRTYSTIPRKEGIMATCTTHGTTLHIETDAYFAAVTTEGYVSGVAGGRFVDKRSGSHDLGFGLMIVDFLLEPGEDDPDTPPPLRYEWGNLYHGHIPKRYVETPQICTQARQLEYTTIVGEGFIAVRQWFQWTQARPPYRPGSTWEQTLLFPDGVRWFLADDRVTSANDVETLFLRTDMPGHLKHQRGDTFHNIYLSYHGLIPSSTFFEDFPPDARYLYRRRLDAIPERFIRAYQLANGTWLAGMALDPSVVYESWCHQRGYVCFIHELGGRRVRAGESFGAVHLIGYFDDLAEMERTFDAHRGAQRLTVDENGWHLQ